jgi:hypothetical protein
MLITLEFFAFHHINLHMKNYTYFKNQRNKVTITTQASTKKFQSSRFADWERIWSGGVVVLDNGEEPYPSIRHKHIILKR